MKLLLITLTDNDQELYLNVDHILTIATVADRNRDDAHAAICLTVSPTQPVFVMESVEEIFDKLNELYRIDGVALPDPEEDEVVETPA